MLTGTLEQLISVERLYSKEFGRSIENLQLEDDKDPKIVLNYKTIFDYPKSTTRAFIFKDKSYLHRKYLYRVYVAGNRKGKVDILKNDEIIGVDEIDSFKGNFYSFYSLEKVIRTQYMSFVGVDNMLDCVTYCLMNDFNNFDIRENGFKGKKNVRYFKSTHNDINLTVYTIKGLVEYNTLRKYYGRLRCLPFIGDPIDRASMLYFAFSTDKVTEDVNDDLLSTLLDIESAFQRNDLPFNYGARLSYDDLKKSNIFI